MKASEPVGQKQKWNCTRPHMLNVSVAVKQFPKQSTLIAPGSPTICLTHSAMNLARLLLPPARGNRWPSNLTPFQGYQKVQKTKFRFWNNTLHASEKTEETGTEILSFPALFHRLQTRRTATASEGKDLPLKPSKKEKNSSPIIVEM